jgi:cellulose synthase/poly-beta-1,6-N-acetylglucosamine synthase-like glycosyltransferase
MHYYPLLLQLFYWVEKFFIFYVATDNGLHFLLFGVGFFALYDRHGRGSKLEVETLVKSPLVPGASILAPAYNEELTICDSVRSMLQLRYPKHDVIVINDGSTDKTMQRLISEFRLYRSSRVPSGELPTAKVRAVYESLESANLLVIDKENSGKADALNAGLNYSTMPLVCAVDADSLIERDALIGVVRPFLEDPEHMVAVGGIVRVLDGCAVDRGSVRQVATPSSLLARFQIVEYLRAFLGGRVALSSLNAVLIISGAFGLFKRKHVLAVGGFSLGTVGEDMELVLKLHESLERTGKERNRIAFIPEPVCWTQVPAKSALLRRQRSRWHRGAMESIVKHWRMIGRKRFGILGMFALPYFIVFELFGPLVELTGLAFTVFGLVVGLIAPNIAVQFFAVSILFNLFLSLSAVVFEELTTRRYPSVKDLFALLVAAFIEGFYYRQLTAWWRTRGLIDYFLRKKGWGTMERKSFQGAGAESVPEAASSPA